ncbi:hypothetical protein [Peribacillus frigoritolerans]|uniref:hypothetical protein n=1 Tax=Peribacillus frigoritolerans TaxID=450367 RepID=UPI001F4FB331|nr:hypothetical protein [Peribacillus frigoritolerans]MCK2020673.1 hypothetical protein [Peribacillus frigoritolerans]
MSRSLIVTSDKDNTQSVTVHAWAILVSPRQGTAIVDPVTMQAEPLEDDLKFIERLKLASPVDRLFPIVFSNAMFRIFATPYQAHTYLEQLWKQ